MKNFFTKNTIELEPLMGTHITSVAKEAVEIADFLKTIVSFTFNEVRLSVKPNSLADNVVQAYTLGLQTVTNKENNYE